jgi:excisionase family DNA binding protein
MSIIKALRERTEPLTVAELAVLLRVGEDTVQRWARQRQIPSIRIGSVIRFDGGMLADWVELQGACTHPIIRPFLHPRAPGNPDDFQMRWEDLADLNPKRNIKPEEKPQNTKTE